MKKLRNFIYDSGHMLELLMALIVLVAILIACFSLYIPFKEFLHLRFENGAFLEFVGYIFNILIGIEFLKMLCRPNTDTVLEVLTFLVARHMIIEETSVMENLITIISIGFLFAMKKYLNLPSSKDSVDIFVTNYDTDRINKVREKAKKFREDKLDHFNNKRKQDCNSDNDSL